MTEASHTQFPIALSEGMTPAVVQRLAALVPRVIDLPPHDGLSGSSKSISWMLANKMSAPVAAVLDAFCESPLHAMATGLFPGGYSFLIDNCAIRRHRPGVAESHLTYHFDASFLGHERTMVNFWVPLTPLEDGAPGLTFLDPALVHAKVWPLWTQWSDNRISNRTGLTLMEDRQLYEMVGSDIAGFEATPKVPPGGALVFDERTLHRTESVDGPGRERLSIEYRIAGFDAIPPAYAQCHRPVLDLVTVDGRFSYRARNT